MSVDTTPWQKQVQMFFYDGPHDAESTRDAVIHYWNTFANEVVLISTCNRTEIYTESNCDNTEIIQWLNNNQSLTKDCKPYTYSYHEEKAIKHLFNVTSGVDSMVIGENEILGQVKEAFKIADQNKCLASSLKRLFEFSFSKGGCLPHLLLK